MKKAEEKKEVWTMPTIKKMDIEETAAGVTGDNDAVNIGTQLS